MVLLQRILIGKCLLFTIFTIPLIFQIKGPFLQKGMMVCNGGDMSPPLQKRAEKRAEKEPKIELKKICQQILVEKLIGQLPPVQPCVVISFQTNNTQLTLIFLSQGNYWT